MTALLAWTGGAVLLVAIGLLLMRGSGRTALAVLLLALAVGLAAARQFAPAEAFAFAAAHFWRRRPRAASAQPSRGQVSEVVTDWLEMALDHDTGTIDGRVRREAFEGRMLSSLTVTELRALRAAITGAGCGQSAALLEAYLARRRPEAAQEDTQARERSAGAGAEMSAEDAYRILGLPSGASREDVRAAYHRLIRKVHPDSGGTSELAALINAARRRLDPG